MSTYLKFADFKGPATGEGLEGFIPLESFNFGASRKVNTQPGMVMDREGSRPHINEVTITKRVDNTTPLFFSESVVGTAKPEVVIKFINTGSKLSDYMEYTLYNVLVSSYNVADKNEQAADGESSTSSKKLKPLETLTLNFDKIEIKYTPYDEKHKAGSPIPTGYDLKTAQAT